VSRVDPIHARICDVFGPKPDISAVASRVGKSRHWVSTRLRIAKLDVRLQRAVDDGALGALDVSQILSVPADERFNMAEMLMARHVDERTARVGRIR